VLYQGEVCLGGGVIERTLSLDAANVNVHIPLDTPSGSDARGGSSPADHRTLADILTDEEAVGVDDMISEEQLISAVKRALTRLTPREEKIMRLRFGISEISEQERTRLGSLGYSPEENVEE
jgi:DNA-directed RNA polymerase sigma subunit (sigma70/sigma32)